VKLPTITPAIASEVAGLLDLAKECEPDAPFAFLHGFILARATDGPRDPRAEGVPVARVEVVRRRSEST